MKPLVRTQEEYLHRLRREKFLVHLIRILIFTALIAAWELAARWGYIDAFVTSSPSRLYRCFCSLMASGSLPHHIRITVAETLLSFALVMGIALLLSILLWWFPVLSKIFEPYLVVLNSLPKSALAPVFIVWFGNNMKTIIIAAVSVAVFGATMTLYHSFCQMEPDKIKLIYTLGGKKSDVLLHLILPGNTRTLLNVSKTNLGLSLVGVIIGEFLASTAGLGYLIIYGSQVFKLDIVLLSIVLLCILATLLYLLLSMAEKLYDRRIR